MNFPIPVRQRIIPDRPSALDTLMSTGQYVTGLQANTFVLGVDASVAKVGFSLACNGMIRSWVFRPKKMGMERLREHREEIARIVQVYRPGVAVIEGYSFGSKASHAHSTGEAGGVIRLALTDASVVLHEASPNSLKKFLSGKGNLPKSGMPLALFKQYGVDYADEDEADAAGLALIGVALTDQMARKLHEYQIDALKGVSQLHPPKPPVQRVAKSVDKEKRIG